MELVPCHFLILQKETLTGVCMCFDQQLIEKKGINSLFVFNLVLAIGISFCNAPFFSKVK